METKKLWETIQNKRLDELVAELEKLRRESFGQIPIKEDLCKNLKSKKLEMEQK